MAAEGGFREDQLVVELDLEATLRRRHQLEGLDDGCPTGEELVRQTDGVRNVVSKNTELDPDPMLGVAHLGLLVWRAALGGYRRIPRSDPVERPPSRARSGRTHGVPATPPSSLPSFASGESEC